MKEISFDYEKEITKAMKELGVPTEGVGYAYLHLALLSAAKDPVLLDADEEELYLAVANAHGVTAEAVAEEIGKAVKISWEKGDPFFYRTWFACSSADGDEEVTAAEFIAMLVDNLHFREKIQ